MLSLDVFQLLAILSFTFFCGVKTTRHDRVSKGIFATTTIFKLCFALLLVAVAYSRLLSTDGYRYLAEMERISREPWNWNPLTGTGPLYQASAKMGMQYFYGWILFFLGGSSLGGIIGLNILFASLSALMARGISIQLSDDVYVHWMTLFMVGVHPEVVFWSARITREPFAIFLVTSCIWLTVRLSSHIRLTTLVSLLSVTLYLSLVRIQLLFIPALALLLVGIFRYFNRAASWALALIATLASTELYELLELQLSRSVGKKFLRFLSLDQNFWVEKIDSLVVNFPRVLSLSTKDGYGAVGAIIVPTSAWTFAFFAVGMLLFPFITISRIKAGLVIAVTVGFWLALAMHGTTNIRFRSEVAPLAVIIASIGFVFCYRSVWRWTFGKFR